MTTTFKIVDGTIYLDKGLYEEAQTTDNELSKLTGSSIIHMFGRRPSIRTGIESMIIDYANSDPITIEANPQLFVQTIQRTYDHRVRGHLIVEDQEGHERDILVHPY